MPKKKPSGLARGLLAAVVGRKQQGQSLPADAGWQAFELLFRNSPQPMWVYDRVSLRFLEVNNAAVSKYGYTRKEFLSMSLADIRPADDVQRLQETVSKPRKSGYRISTGWQHVCKGGTPIYVTIHSHALAYQDHDAVLVMAADVTELYNTIEQLEEQTAYFQQLFSNSPDGIVLLDSTGNVLDANVAFQKIFGYARDELVGRAPLSLIVPETEARQSVLSFDLNQAKRQAVRMATVRRHKDGTRIDVEILAYPVDVKGKELGVFAIYHDISERQHALTELEYQAQHDTLTGLVNRNEFVRQLTSALQQVHDQQAHYALLYLDIDQFKVINDICGHAVGDRVIVELAELLRTSLQDTNIVARLGGDEFAVLLAECDRATALQTAEQLLKAVGNYQFTWNTLQFPLAASIGVVVIGDDLPGIAEVFSAADAACYAAKEKGRNRIQLYQHDDEHFVSRKNEMAWVSKLNTAIEKNQFVLYYQEMHPLADNSALPRRCEILIRYRGDDGKLIAPGAFVLSAERYNLMPAIDRWVLKTVCTRAMEKEQPADRMDMLSVNVSGTTLSDEHFPDFVKQTLAETGYDPAALCFEVTETAAISNLELAMRFIDEVKALGCSISLDDFGSGMSSFSYLRELKVDYLKIDGTFIKNMHKNPIDLAMTEAIANVGKILGLTTIAEFVENEEIVELLREIGVDYAQGYGVHKPEPWLEQDTIRQATR